MHCPAQPTPRNQLRDYIYKIIVAGSRDYDDYPFFSQTMHEYISCFDKKDVIFITGKAKTGADDMIIRWCIENEYPWCEFPAEWDNLEAENALVLVNKKTGKPYNARAGFARNVEMAKVATNLIVFWNAESKGTRHMLDTAKAHKLDIMRILIDIVKKEDKHGWQSQGSGSGDTGVHREASAW